MDEIHARGEGNYPRFVMESGKLLFKLFDPVTGVDRTLCHISLRRALIMLADLTKFVALMVP